MKAQACAIQRVNRVIGLWLSLSALLLSASAVFGDTLTWDGSSSTSWGTAANWVENAVPADGDTLIFPSAAANKACVNNIVGLDVYKIEIKGTGYSLSGNTINLIESIRINTTFLTVASMYMDVDLVDDAQIRMMGYNNHLLCYGDIDMGSYDLSVGNYGLVRLYGVVSGSGAVTKFGTGIVSFNGSSANIYTGTTTVEDGTLELDQVSGNSIPRDLIIEDGATVLQKANSRIQDDVTIYGSGIYDMDGFSETIDSLILYDGADVDSGTATLTLRDDVIVDDGISSIDGSLSLISGIHECNILFNGLVLWPGAHCYLNADVSGAGSIVKKGPGDMKMSGNNTYSGTTTVQGGDIMIESNTALGTTAGGTTVNAGSKIYMSAFNPASSMHVSGETLSLGGDIYSYGITSSWSGAITLTDDVEVRVTTSDILNLSGAIDGTGGITKDWAGTLIYSGAANSYSGDTVVNDGTLLLDKSGDAIRYGTLTIGDGPGSLQSVVVRELQNYQIGTIPIIIHGDGFLDVDNYTDTVGAITFASGGTAGTFGTGTLKLGGNVTYLSSSNSVRFYGNLYLSGTRTFDVASNVVYTIGNDMLLYGTVSGSSGAGLIKTGAGGLTIHGANTYTGDTTINDGPIWARDPLALGTTAGGTRVEGTGLLHIYNENIADETLTLAPAANGKALTSQGNSSWSGNVVLEKDALIAPSGTLDLSGVISGSGSVTIYGHADYDTLTMSGSSANTYSGDTSLTHGKLLLNKSGIAIRDGTLTIGTGSGIDGDDEVIVRAMQNNQIHTDAGIVIHEEGWLDMDDYSDYVGPITFNGGHAGSSATGTVGLSGNVTVNATEEEALIDGKLVLTGTRSFSVANSTVGYDLRVTAAVSGSGMIKAGSGNMALYGANTYTGSTAVNQGGLYVRNASALGTAAGGTTVTGSGYLYVVGQNVIDEPLTLDVPESSGIVLYVSSTSSWSGDVVLDEDARIRLSSTGTFDISGAISGTGGLYLYGGGDFSLSGSVGNSHGGDTHIEEGLLLLNKTGNSVPQSLVIGGTGAGDAAATARQLSTGEVGQDVIVNTSGTYDLEGKTETIQNLILNGGGDVYTDAGLLQVSVNIDVDPLDIETPIAYIYGNLDLYNDCTITTGQDDPAGGNAVELVIHAIVSGNDDIIKEGEGELRFYGANTYSGPVVHNNGTLDVYNDLALGTTANGISVNGDAVLRLYGSRTVTGEALVLNSTYSGYSGMFDYRNGTSTWTGNITMQKDAHIGSYSTSGSLDLSGTISGSGDLIKVYNGTLTLSGLNANIYTGDTLVNGGTLVLDKSGSDRAIPGRIVVGDGAGGAGADVVRLMGNNQIANTADMTLASSGLFDLDGHYDRMDAVTGSGSVELGSGYLIAGHNDSSFTFGGMASGSGFLWKVGTGIWTLTANNAYTGTTRIQYGTLVVNGSQPASAVTVYADGTLGGIGTVGAIASSGTVAPGTSAGQLGSGSATLQSVSSFDVELNGHTLVDYDQLDVGGSVGISNANLVVNWGFMPAEGNEFTIIDNDGGDAVEGIFNGLDEGASVVVGDVTLEITYQGGTGNDVVLVATSVPMNPLTITSISVNPTNVWLEWEGGLPNYVVEKKTSLTNATWMAVTPPATNMEASVSPGTTNGFYRVTGGNE